MCALVCRWADGTCSTLRSVAERDTDDLTRQYCLHAVHEFSENMVATLLPDSFARPSMEVRMPVPLPVVHGAVEELDTSEPNQQ